MRWIFTPKRNSFSPLNCQDTFETSVKQGDEVWISVVFTWDTALAESMANYYQNIVGAVVKLGGPAYGDPGGEFTPGLFTAPGVTITSRGCPKQCPWCYVPKREGGLRYLEIKEGNCIQDNNIIACNKAHKDKVWAMLRKQRGVSLRGGLDAHFLKDEDVESIRGLRLADLFLAYDHDNNRSVALRAISKFRRAGVPQSKIRCYALVGFDGDTIEAAEDRCRHIYAYGGMPFAQLYDKCADADLTEWKRMARRWSRPAIYKDMMRPENVLKGLI